jgi:hypothetical protein
MHLEKTMPDYTKDDLIESLLDQTYTKDGKSIEIEIYRMLDTAWNVQVVDTFGNSTVWDDEFESDKEALQFVLAEIERDGIDEFIGPPSNWAVH